MLITNPDQGLLINILYCSEFIVVVWTLELIHIICVRVCESVFFCIQPKLLKFVRTKIESRSAEQFGMVGVLRSGVCGKVKKQEENTKMKWKNKGGNAALSAFSLW